MKNNNITYIIYKITSPSGRIYVGQTTDPFKHRMSGHKTVSRLNGRGCTSLNNAIRKYGWDNMKCEIIMECSSLIMLNHIEDRFVEMWSLRNRDIGMNLRRAGDNNTGYKHTEEAKKKISLAMSKVSFKRPVKAFDKDTGNFIAWYFSTTKAAKDYKVDRKAISNSIRIKGKCKGLKWEYA